jgi:hypothetical protein
LPEEFSKHAALSNVIDAGNSRIASHTELWSVFSKIFAFDEPASKSQHLRKAARKQLEKRVNFDAISLREQGHVFSTVFGNSDDRNDSEVAKMVNFTLAFEDLNRFTKLAFDTWMKPEWQSELIDEDVSKLNFELATAEKLWLTNAVLSKPNWKKLHDNDQWRDDPRVQLLVSFIDKLTDSAELAGSSAYTYALQTWRQLLDKHRSELPGSFLPKIIVLAEGQTEALILPTFAKLLGVNFNTIGVHLESCGGAKQVVKQYLNLKELTVLPILCILDADVSESAEIIQDSLRSQDRIVTMRAGEIEDSFSLPTFHRLLNIYLKETGCLEPIAATELLTTEGKRIGNLDRLFRIRGLGYFDKIGFAETAVRNLHKSDVPEDGKRIIGTIQEVSNAGIKLRFQ